MNYMKWGIKILIAVMIMIIAGIVSYAVFSQSEKVLNPEPIACTMEAKMCPDGSYVGRTGPLCEFAPCPVDPAVGWENASSISANIDFKYPKDIGTTYIHPVDWPPQFTILNTAFTCTEAGAEMARAGKTEIRMIGATPYCITTESEGAAGSTYTNFAYAFAYGQQTAIMTFSLRSVQCGNYDESERIACENERDAFSIDTIANRIAQSITPSTTK